MATRHGAVLIVSSSLFLSSSLCPALTTRAGHAPSKAKAGAQARASPAGAKRKGYVPTKDYAKTSLEGWTVYINKELLGAKSALGKEAQRLLEFKLYEIRRAVPARACRKLQEVPIWLGVNDGHAPCSEYHPNQQWLRDNGYNPDKAKCVEIGNSERFLDWSQKQPAMVIHELCHAYHDRVLGYEHSGIKAAYKKALKSGIYDSVLRNNGNAERAYALENEKEYFAEGCEAYFGTNDFFPFVRVELEKHDPQLYKVMEAVWNRAR
jgi:hypothetical protein